MEAKERITLTDQDGNAYAMDLLERFMYQNSTYVIMSDTEDDKDDISGGAHADFNCGYTPSVNIYVMREDTRGGKKCYDQIADDMIDEIVELVKAMMADNAGYDTEEDYE